MYSRLGLHLNGLVVASMWQSLQECRVKGVSSGEGGGGTGGEGGRGTLLEALHFKLGIREK